MIEKYSINNIEPFNEVFYNDCYFNSLFPIVQHFEKDINYILVNDIFHYKSMDDCRDLLVEFNSITKLHNLLFDMGIKVECKVRCDNLISEIKSSILKDKPVIVAIDCFYSPYILDTYKKRHTHHTVLIYGYNDLTKIFDIIDLEILDNLTYKKNIIAYNDLIHAYEADIIKKSQVNLENTFFAYEITDTEKQQTSISNIFMSNMLSMKDYIIKGLDDLKRYICYFNESGNKGIVKSQDVLNSFVQVFNSKKVEYYRFKRIFGEDNCLTLEQYKIKSIWHKIMSQYGLYHYSPKKSESKTTQVSNLLESAYNMELEFIKKNLLF